MKPLTIEPALLKLSSQYPDAESFRDTLTSLSRYSREWVVRLWLSEGIPVAFRDRPAIYEAMRAWLGRYLKVCPKEVTLLGSGRLGFSLAPPNYGREFNAESDLDLSVVSPSLFGELSKSFTQWKSDYDAQVVQPRGEIERRYWDENVRRVPYNLSNGFVDANKVPTRSRYPIAQVVGNGMWMLKCKLDLTEGAPKVRRTSLRVYDSWRALVDRVSFNLHIAMSK